MGRRHWSSIWTTPCSARGEDRHDEKRQVIYEFWNKIPAANKAWLEVVGLVPFEDILDIDELGDAYVQAPHVYATFAAGMQGPFKGFIPEIESIGRWDRRSYYP